MEPRRRTTVLAWSLFALWAAVAVSALWIGAWEGGGAESIVALLSVGYAVVGALVASRHPENAVGWLLLGVALTVALQLACETYLAANTSAYQTVAWFADWLINVSFYLALVFLPLLFPDGRLLSSRWRIVWWFDIVTLVASVVVVATTPGDLSVNVPASNPIEVQGATRAVVTALNPWLLPVALLALLLSAISVVIRFHRSTGIERQQLKWFVAATLVVVVGFVLTSAEGIGTPWARAVGEIGWAILPLGVVLAFPLATGFAILRYRLFDIDVVINQTLVYGALTAVLAATYVVSILLLRIVVSPLTGKSDLAVAVSTLAVAALFRPARARIQEVVDRRFYRRRYDAVHTLEDFTTRLRHELDLDAVGSDLCITADRTMQPAHVSLWLRAR